MAEFSVRCQFNEYHYFLSQAQWIEMSFILCRPANSFKKLSENVQFVWYLMYGFGIPCLLISIVYIVDKIKTVPKYLRPGFDDSSCVLFSENFQILFVQIKCFWNLTLILSSFFSFLRWVDSRDSTILLASLYHFNRKHCTVCFDSEKSSACSTRSKANGRRKIARCQLQITRNFR